VSQVNLHSNLKRIILDASHEKINELRVFNLRNIGPYELSNVIVLTVHLKNEQDLFLLCNKPLSVVKRNSCFGSTVDKDLFIESLVVLTVVVGLENHLGFEK